MHGADIVVDWDDVQCRFVKAMKTLEYPNRIDCAFDDIDSEYIEVIGNVHDEKG